MLQKRLLIVGALAVLLIPAVPVFARDGSDDADQTATTSVDNENETENSADTTSRHRSDSRLEDNETRLEAGKLRACHNREKSINTRLHNIVNRGTRQMKVFDLIAQRVEKFAEDKNAKPINYDDLVNAVNNEKAFAQAAVDKVKGDSVSFKCDGTDPKSALEIFKSDQKAEINALKSYRTSIKNLIVGVKTAITATEGGSNDSTQ